MWTLLATAVVVSAVLTWVSRVYALRRRLVDEPGARRSHRVATPRGGGVGPVIAFAALITAGGWLGWLGDTDWRLLLASLLSVAAIGAWDDHRPLGAGVRLVVHIAAGIGVAAAFGLWAEHPLAAVATAGLTVVLVNVWNFMDGIDGIAATQAVIVALAGALLGAPEWAWLSMGCIACVAGFLPFNFPRARIFMGDVGSGGMGVILAVLATGAAMHSEQVATGALLLFPASAFLVDSAMTLGRRMLRGEHWWTAHTQHLYQHMARRHGHVRVTLAYAAWSLAGLLLALGVASQPVAVILASVMLWYTACAGIWARLQHASKGRSAAA